MVWQKFCCERGIDSRKISLKIITDFLVHCFEDLKWSPKYVEQCKFALQSLLPHTAPYFSHLLVKHLVTGFFYEKPQQPRLKDTVWDANIVLDALAKYPGYEALAMAWHSVKLTLLILLSTMARNMFCRYWILII